MCGIAGFLEPSPRPQAEGILRAMLARIAHRGPDGEGVWLDGPAALGHRRLAILDAAGGAQPFFNEDRTVAVVFNGEIYNCAALRARLEAAGHRFVSRCDTEVLVHGWEQWGRDLPGKLRGMFAFALWDRRAAVLFCARDPFGIKPLYYYRAGDALLFGSEIKCFLPHPAFRKAVNTAQLGPYLSFQYSPGEDTFFAGVKKLPPAHWLYWQAGAVTLGRYDRPAFAPAAGPAEPAAWAGPIHTAMQDSVRAHLQADVPVGSFLSSGVDSAYIAALSGAQDVFTVGFSDRRYSELDKAGRTAQALGARLHGRVITPEEYWSALGQIQYAMDEPLGDASAPALWFLAREAAQYVKVCLSGEGADELFGGYNVYTEPFACTWYDRIPLPLRRAAGAAAERLPPAPGVNFVARRGRPLGERYIGNTNLMNEVQKRRLLRQYPCGPAAEALARPWLEQAAALGPVLQMESCDLNLWLPGDILLKADKMSMAHSLEVRVPFLDREVFAVAGRLPAACRTDGRGTKLALRAAAGQVLPPALCGRRKLGFPAPVRAWLQQPEYLARVEAAFRSPEAAQFFRPKALEALLRRHRQGRCDLWRQIWCIYMFLVWYRAYFVER